MDIYFRGGKYDMVKLLRHIRTTNPNEYFNKNFHIKYELIKLLENVPENVLKKYITNYDDNDDYINILKYCKCVILNDKDELNIDFITYLLPHYKSVIKNVNFISNITCNKYMTCKLFLQFYNKFTGLPYAGLEFIFTKDITPQFINHMRQFVYLKNCIRYMVKNPLLTPEMLFSKDIAMYFELIDIDKKYTKKITKQHHAKYILHHLNIPEDYLLKVANINYYIYTFKMPPNYNFDNKIYKSYCDGELILNRDNFYYTTRETKKLYILLKLCINLTRDILLKIITIYLYTLNPF